MIPAVSIVMPVYNGADLVRQTVESIAAQDFTDWELIVVNDGSTDETLETVRSIDPAITLIDQANAGISAARNTGIRAARARLIAFIDHDDYWHAEKLSAQTTAMHAHPEVGVAFGEFLRWDAAQPPAFPDAHLDPTRMDSDRSGWVYHRFLQTNWMQLSTALFRREVFDRVGLFDTSLAAAEDWDMALRTAREFQLLKLAQPVALYREHALQFTRRPSIRNHEAEYRAQAMREFGLVGPDGSRADVVDLKRRQVRAFLNHALLHLENGDPAVAVRSAWRAIHEDITSLRAWRACARAYGKMLVPPMLRRNKR